MTESALPPGVYPAIAHNDAAISEEHYVLTVSVLGCYCSACVVKRSREERDAQMVGEQLDELVAEPPLTREDDAFDAEHYMSPMERLEMTREYTEERNFWRRHEEENAKEAARTHNDKGEALGGQPERLKLLNVGARVEMVGEYEQVVVTVCYAYEPWCCNGAHEIADAIKAATKQVVELENDDL